MMHAFMGVTYATRLYNQKPLDKTEGLYPELSVDR